MSESSFHILDIIKGTTVDGPGFRTAIYMAGCRHDCPFCHNPESHNPMAGRVMGLDEILAVVEEEDFDVTLTGGDPLYDSAAACALASAIKDRGYGIWLYTGYTIEEIRNSPSLSKIIPLVDVIVDGPFIESLKDSDLPFRGSSNQRIINLRNGDFDEINP